MVSLSRDDCNAEADVEVIVAAGYEGSVEVMQCGMDVGHL